MKEYTANVSPSDLALRRLWDACGCFAGFHYQLSPDFLHTPGDCPLCLPFSVDPTDSVGISWFWGLTVETLPGAAFFYVARWHDEREKRFDMPVMEAATLALRWARFTADSWPDKSERWKLQVFVRTLGPLLYVNAAKWKLRGKK